MVFLHLSTKIYKEKFVNTFPATHGSLTLSFFLPPSPRWDDRPGARHQGKPYRMGGRSSHASWPGSFSDTGRKWLLMAKPCARLRRPGSGCLLHGLEGGFQIL
jgi:hypothetical protein